MCIHYLERISVLYAIPILANILINSLNINIYAHWKKKFVTKYRSFERYRFLVNNRSRDTPKLPSSFSLFDD